MTIPVQSAVRRLIEARVNHQLVAPLSETWGDFGLAEAYAVQDALCSELEGQGDRPIGWKLAATAPVGQAIMGVTEPACGFLSPRRYASSETVSAGEFADLRLEAEVAFRMRAPLAGPGVTAASARDAVEGAMPAFELLDFIYAGTPKAGDYVANSIHGKAVAIGDAITDLHGLDMALEGVVFEHNGDIVGTHTAAEVMGDPLNALAWLANFLGDRGKSLKPGDLVISGGITKLLRPQIGDTVRARFTHLGSMSISIAA